MSRLSISHIAIGLSPPSGLANAVSEAQQIHFLAASLALPLARRLTASASDLADESLRRLVVNGVFWGLGLEVPAKADVTPVVEWKPSKYSFNMFHPGLKAEDFAGVLPPPLTAAPAKKKK